MNWANDLLVRVSFLLRLETGAVSAEYGLILTLVVLVTILAIGAFGIAVSGLIDRGADGFPSTP
jgi:Flp pilus assembly pilin Flp